MIYIQVRGSNDSDWNYIMVSDPIRPHTLRHKSCFVRPCDCPQWRCTWAVSYLSKLLALRRLLVSVLFFCRVFFLTASVDLNRMSLAQLTHGKLTNPKAVANTSRVCRFSTCHIRVCPLAASTVSCINTKNQYAALKLAFLDILPLHISRGWNEGERLLLSPTSSMMDS